MKIVKINKISLGHRLSLKDIHRDSTDISISDLKDFRFFLLWTNSAYLFFVEFLYRIIKQYTMH